MYLTIRALHVLCGAIWVGVAVMSALWLVPMTADLGPDASKVAASLKRRGYIAAIPVIAMTAIMSGSWLYWRYTGGFSPEVSRTPAAMAFGTGGVLALIAFIVGALGISRNMIKAMAVMDTIASAGEADRRRLVETAQGFRHRAAIAGRIVAGLVVVTTILMSIAHYL